MSVGKTLESDKLKFKFLHLHLLAVLIGQIAKSYGPQFPHLQNRANNAHLDMYDLI